MKGLLTWMTMASLAAAGEEYRVYTATGGAVQQYRFGVDAGEFKLASTTKISFQGRIVELHPKLSVLYVSGRQGKAGVTASYMLKDDGSLGKGVEHMNAICSCAQTIDYSHRYVIGASYRTGEVEVLKIDGKGMISERTQLLDAKRKTAHDICLSLDNKNLYLPFVKENNALYQYKFDVEKGSFTPHAPLNVEPPEGTGPRNGYAHANGKLYFSNEQGVGVSVYTVQNDGTLKLLEVEPSPVKVPEGASVSASFMVGTPDGKYLYVGVREKTDHGIDQVVGYKVKENGEVDKVASIAFPNKLPWGAKVSPCGKFLFVSSPKSKTLHAYSIDAKGQLKELSSIVLPGKVNSLAVR